jgi:hypothetical protein
LGIATVVQYAVGENLGLEEILLQEPWNPQINILRLSPGDSILIFIVGVSSLCLAKLFDSPIAIQGVLVSLWLGVILCLIGLLTPFFSMKQKIDQYFY